ncbi:hypothetical protein D3C80_2121130 [compost metagenome]
MLAGLPNAPSAYALSTKNNLAKQRQNMIIDAMSKYNYIDAKQAEKLKNTED